MCLFVNYSELAQEFDVIRGHFHLLFEDFLAQWLRILRFRRRGFNYIQYFQTTFGAVGSRASTKRWPR